MKMTFHILNMRITKINIFFLLTLPLVVSQDIEDVFAAELGNGPTKQVRWSIVQKCPIDKEFIKVNCIKIQKAFFAMFGSSFEVNVDAVDVDIFESVLRFNNKRFDSMEITVVKYSLDGSLRPGSEQTHRFLTGGDESTCVFFMSPSKTEENSFYLDDYVCESTLFRLPEDIFIQQLGNDPNELVKWSVVQGDAVDKELVKTYCIEIQNKLNRSSGGSSASVETAVDEVDEIFEGVLQFQNKDYKPMKVMVVQYSLGRPGRQVYHHFLTGGEGSDFVYYLTPHDSQEKSFYIDQLFRISDLEESESSE